ncbi:hypothetical protein, partial [Amycolatopsis lurida]|uniref:hypothetical protein n=1 Tax=Amycolatopsis lurida TaxID=31959 RepID=UPI0036503199
LKEADALVDRRLPPDEIRPKLPAIKAKYKMTELTLVVETADEKEATVHFDGKVNPGDRTSGKKTNKEKLYSLEYTSEKRAQFRLAENPAEQFPRDVRDALDAAQQTVSENNKPTAKLGDGSTPFAAIMETVSGKSHTGGTLHITKTTEYKKGLARHLANDRLPERAKELLRAEKTKCDDAESWCKAYTADEQPPLPTWAGPYGDQLEAAGLPPGYPGQEPEDRRRGRNRRGDR